MDIIKAIFGNLSFRGQTKGTVTIIFFGGLLWAAGALLSFSQLAWIGFVIFAAGCLLTYMFLRR